MDGDGGRGSFAFAFGSFAWLGPRDTRPRQMHRGIPTRPCFNQDLRKELNLPSSRPKARHSIATYCNHPYHTYSRSNIFSLSRERERARDTSMHAIRPSRRRHNNDKLPTSNFPHLIGGARLVVRLLDCARPDCFHLIIICSTLSTT